MKIIKQQTTKTKYMKRNVKNLSAAAIIIIINMLIGSSIFAQSPEAFKYQAIARNASGNVIANQNVSFRVSLLETSETGTTVYVETHNLTTNNFGLANLNIGEGSPVSGNFSTIDWAADKHFLKVEMDAAGGTSYQLMGTSQLLSVPYALYSENAGNMQTYTAGTGIDITGTTINNTAPDQTVLLTGQGATSVSGTYPNFTISSTDTNTTYTAGIGIDINGITINNTAPDQIVSLTGQGGTTVSGTYPNFNISSSSSDSSKWLLNGNSGTVPGTNFLGTIDSVDLVIKTNNLERMRITTKGQIETYNTGNSVFIGEGAGANDDLSSNNNVFIGYQSGYSNTTGDKNTANGYMALYSNTTAAGNTANGYMALYSNTTGHSNTANGNNALYDNTTGNYNVANGYLTLRSNTTGSCNTASGYDALRFNTTGNYNTANGLQALRSNTTGNNNTAIGFNAFSSGTDYSNSTAIGYNANITESNQIRLGNASVTSIGGQVAWSTVSDMRFKKDVKENVPGLDFIMKLKPVTYYLDMDAIAKFTNTPDSLRLKDAEALKGKMLQTGFIAQDVEKAASECGFEFSGVDAPKNENDYYGLRYAEFVVPLVKAVQEQQTTIDKQQIINDKQQKEIESLKSELQKLNSINERLKKLENNN